MKKVMLRLSDEAHEALVEQSARDHRSVNATLVMLVEQHVAGPQPRRAKGGAEPCTHPIGRRIGKQCAVCGALVGK